MDEEEVWPPAPQGTSPPALPPDVTRPAARLQVALGLVAGIVFFPVLYVLLLHTPHYRSVPNQAFAGAALFAALSLSALARHRFRSFSITFAVISVILAGLILVVLEMPVTTETSTPL